jgi:hypothetical protein
MIMSYVKSAAAQLPVSQSWQQGCKAIAHNRYWFFLLLSVGTVSNVLYTCTVPLVGFGAIAGATLPRYRAFMVILSMWFVNQLLGFTLRQYPWTLSTFAWGFVMLLGTVLTTLLALQKPAFSQRKFAGYGAWLGISLALGFVLYQAVIGLASLGLGGIESFTIPVLWSVLQGNALWATAIGIIHSLFVLDILKRQKA